MINAKIEELLENLYVQQTEGRAFDVAACPGDIMAEATGAGYVESEGGTWRLTPRGAAIGRDVIRRHRLAERLFSDVLEIKNGESTEDDACEFEHILQHGLDDRICVLLGHPVTCPHGKPIPEGECCRKARLAGTKEVAALCDGKADQEGSVAYLSTRDNKEIQKLMAMGILPGVHVRLMRRFPSYVFQVGYSQFTVDRQLAEKIYVHWGPKHGA